MIANGRERGKYGHRRRGPLAGRKSVPAERLIMNYLSSLPSRLVPNIANMLLRVFNSRTPASTSAGFTSTSASRLLLCLPWTEPAVASAMHSYMMNARSIFSPHKSMLSRYSRAKTRQTSWAPSLALPPLIPTVMTWLFPPTMEDVYELDNRST